MESFLVIWLGSLVLTVVTLAVLCCRLYCQRDPLSWILVAFFFLCQGFIWTKWYLRLDLAMYDAPKYHYFASQIAGLLQADFWGNLPYILKPYGAYTLPLGFIYYVLGVSEPLGQTLNAVVGLGVILNVHHLARLWFNPRVADRTALLLALYPFFWVLSGTLNRDMMILYCITGFFRGLTDLGLKGQPDGRAAQYLRLLGCLLYMSLLRPPLLILGGLAGFVFWVSHQGLLPYRARLFRMVRLLCVVLILAVGSVVFLLYGSYYLRATPVDREGLQYSSLDDMNQRLRISEKAGSAYLKGVSYSSLVDVLKVMPLGTFYFLLAPLPWQVASAKQALGLLDSFWLLGVYVFFPKGQRDLLRRQRKLGLALLAFLALGVALSGVLQANAGSAMRHRTMFTLLMFPGAVYGWSRAGSPQEKAAGRREMDDRSLAYLPQALGPQ